MPMKVLKEKWREFVASNIMTFMVFGIPALSIVSYFFVQFEHIEDQFLEQRIYIDTKFHVAEMERATSMDDLNARFGIDEGRKREEVRQTVLQLRRELEALKNGLDRK